MPVLNLLPWPEQDNIPYKLLQVEGLFKNGVHIPYTLKYIQIGKESPTVKSYRLKLKETKAS